MKLFKDPAEATDFMRWTSTVTGSQVMPFLEGEEMHAMCLYRIFKLCKNDLLFLVEHPLQASFVEWLYDHKLDSQIPPLEDNPDDPDAPDARKQLQWIGKRFHEYKKEFENSMIFKAKDMNGIVDELLTDPELSPIFTGTKKAPAHNTED